jgi:glutaryl-CoA dehydrogenase
MATGLQMGAYEAALKYTQERTQFGKPIAAFQLVRISSPGCSPT